MAGQPHITPSAIGGDFAVTTQALREVLAHPRIAGSGSVLLHLCREYLAAHETRVALPIDIDGDLWESACEAEDTAMEGLLPVTPATDAELAAKSLAALTSFLCQFGPNEEPDCYQNAAMIVLLDTVMLLGERTGA